MNDLITKLKQQEPEAIDQEIEQEEGFKTNFYLCTAGHNTFGFGYNADANPLHLSKEYLDNVRKNGITRDEAETLLIQMIDEVQKTLLVKIEGFSNLDRVRQDVLTDMAYNIGVSGLLKFKNTLAHIRAGLYDEAANEMLDSNWAHQVHGRANKLAEQMRTGYVK